MKKSKNYFAIAMILIGNTLFAQTAFKDYKAGHIFNVSLPEYMTKTTGLNSAATIQFKNTIKDVAGIIIEDDKEQLRLAELNYTSINEFYEEFIKDFLNDEEKRTVSKPQSKKVGETNFLECDVSYYEKESKIDIYYFVGIVETPTTYYKLLCWGTLESKDKFKADFQKILYSIKD